MKEKDSLHENKALEMVVNHMALAARTAPKTKGIDNIEIHILKKQQVKSLAKEMEKISKIQNRPGFYRDAQSLKVSSFLILIGVKSNPANIDYCGFCGCKNCAELLKKRVFVHTIQLT